MLHVRGAPVMRGAAGIPHKLRIPCGLGARVYVSISLCLLAGSITPLPAHAQSAREIIDRVGRLMRGESSIARPGVVPDPTAVGHRPSDAHEPGGRERACVGRFELVGWGQFESSGWLLSRIRRRYSGSCYRDPVGVRGAAAGRVRVALALFLIWGTPVSPCSGAAVLMQDLFPGPGRS